MPATEPAFSRYRCTVALAPYLISDGILVLDPTPDVDAILIRAADIAAKAMAASGGTVSADALLESLRARESQRSTGTAEGVAFPHALIPGLPRSLVVVIHARGAVPFDAHRCDLIFAMFGDADHPWEHVRLLARLARLTATPEARDRLRAASDDEALLAAIQAEDEAHG